MKKNIIPKMVSTKTKNRGLSCSTPEQAPESPSRDSDSLCDSDTGSPVPFICTQDGVEGDTDVVWNYYTPKSDNAKNAKLKNSTPISRRKPIKQKVIESPLPRRRIIKATQKKCEIFQDLIELNKNLQNFIAKKSSTPKKNNEEDIFNDSDNQGSPKSGLKTNSRCLRRNVLSSKFNKPDPETALESDDSMNECLILASQVVEENLHSIPAKRSWMETKGKCDHNFKMDTDSMDNILNTINLSSPVMKRVKNSPCFANDSFDSLVGNLNDSTLEQLTQMPIKDKSKKLNTSNTDWTVQDVVMHDSPSAKNMFSRHNSMPESPVTDLNKPSTSGMVFGRYNSVPSRDTEKNTADSPIRCTQDEIRRKHLQAREKLLAKRQLPFTNSQSSQISATQNVVPKTTSFQPRLPISMNAPVLSIPKKTSFQPKLPSTLNQTQNVHKNTSYQPTIQPPAVQNVHKKTSFQPRVPSTSIKAQNEKTTLDQKTSQANNQNTSRSTIDLKQIIERKRLEALQKLRRRQPQNKK